MAIDGIDKSGIAADLLRRADQERQLQDQADIAQKDTTQIEQERAKEQGAAGHALHEPNQDPKVSGDLRPDQAVAELEESKRTGVEMHEDAVSAASVQQDKGEDWQKFSLTQKERELPPSVEDKAKQAQESADRQQQEETVNVADLMKQMAIQSGKISS